jgi:hypothetical protein
MRYFSLEEMREAQRQASRRFYAKKKEQRAEVPREEKPIPKSYTVEYHRERYQMKKQERLLTSATPDVTETELF